MNVLVWRITRKRYLYYHAYNIVISSDVDIGYGMVIVRRVDVIYVVIKYYFPVIKHSLRFIVLKTHVTDGSKE